MHRTRTTLIRDVTVLTMDQNRTVIPHGSILVGDGVIQEVCRDDQVDGIMRARPPLDTEVRQLKRTGMVALPGLINCHTHVSEILLRGGVGCDRGLYDWQWNVTYPAVRRLVARDVHVGALLFSIEAMQTGTTTFVDNANSAFSFELASAAIQAFKSTGLRAVLARIIAAGPLPENRLLQEARRAQGPTAHIDPESLLDGTDDVFEELNFLMAEHNWNHGDKVAVWPAPHKPNRTSIESILRCHDLAAKHNTMVSQPICEVESERRVGDQSAFEYLQHHGALNSRTLLGHCTHASEGDISLIANAGAAVAHLPAANLFLGSGVAPVPDMIRSGVSVCLGTDNANCNNSANMFREMALCALLHKGVRRDAAALSAQLVLDMATRNGAKALGMESTLGSIEKGKRADIVLVDTSKVNLTPLHDPVGTVMYQATGAEVDTVIVEGDVLLEHGEPTFLSPDDVADLRMEAQRRSCEILKRTETLDMRSCALKSVGREP